MRRTPAQLPGMLATFALLGLLAGSATADDMTLPGLDAPVSEEHPFKLTYGSYRLSESGGAQDINLRHSSDLGNVWLGQFRAKTLDVDQWRAGWDSSFGDTLRFMPSLQMATGGFVGGSAQFEIGSPWFVGAGFGRTNLKPYWNLNFDPNDAVFFSAGVRQESGRTFALQYIQDNREHPDQKHLHFYFRQPLPNKQRLTVDILHKQGLVEDERIRRWGWSLTYDWSQFFLRTAWDPKANFGTEDLWRFSLGVRF